MSSSSGLAPTPIDWEALRWRRIDWSRIPYPSRVPVLPYLSVVDNVAFSSAMHNKHDRKLLLKSYKGAHLPAFDRYVYRREQLRGGALGDEEGRGRARHEAAFAWRGFTRWCIDGGRGCAAATATRQEEVP
jgi:hypothetical protein